MQTAPAQATLRIEGDMTIYRAAELRELLVEALQDPQPLALDLSGVTECDSAGLQLLLAAHATAAERGQPLQVAHASAALHDMLALFGLDHSLTAG